MKTSRFKYLQQGKILKDLRHGKGLALRDVASLKGLNISRLWRLEACTHEATIGEIMSLERFYATDIFNVLRDVGVTGGN